MEEGDPLISNGGRDRWASEREETVAILGLRPFERFVFVMSVLERYSDQDCSVLLGCARRDVVAARLRAFQQLDTQSNFALSGR
jgi:DNA-directed RNA polymerase specialized sigma24 family protein